MEASGHAAAGPAALTALRIHRGCSVDHLAGVLGLTHSGTVRLVDRLEEDGLVRRGQGQDARVVTLELTTKGARRASRVAAARAEAVEGFLGEPRPTTSADVLLRLVEKIVVSGMVDWRKVQHRCRLCDLEACHAGGDSCPLDAHMAAGVLVALTRAGCARSGPRVGHLDRIAQDDDAESREDDDALDHREVESERLHGEAAEAGSPTDRRRVTIAPPSAIPMSIPSICHDRQQFGVRAARGFASPAARCALERSHDRFTANLSGNPQKSLALFEP